MATIKSIEEKAKRYDEAMKAAVVAHKDEDRHLKATLERIFPELKESEDESIRKAILEHIQLCTESIPNRDKFIAWLEKQGEPNPAFDIDIPFGAKDSELIEASYYIPEGFHAEIEGNNVVIKKGEQNPAWSEEDKKMIEAALQFAHEYGRHGLWCWLKSLKDRVLPQNTWKPSNEQMKGIECTIKTLKYQLNVGDNRLNSLYNDLKKLRG